MRNLEEIFDKMAPGAIWAIRKSKIPKNIVGLGVQKLGPKPKSGISLANVWDAHGIIFSLLGNYLGPLKIRHRARLGTSGVCLGRSLFCWLLVLGPLVAGLQVLQACWMPFWSSLKGSPGPALKSGCVPVFSRFLLVSI